uniref:Transmembrane protein n=1 Tax=Moniliophthora roreri TaxID=221103 RepID=A0A0W0GEU7_MONRR
MPSFRAISYYLVAALAAVSFTSAIPTPLLPVDAIAPAVHARCGECEANPLPVLVRGVQDKITPLADKLKNLPAADCTRDNVAPIVKEIKDIIIDASAKVRVYLDADVDLDILLAGSANGGAAISVEAFASILAGLVNVVVTACVSVLNLKVDLEVMMNILADLLVVGLSASLILQIGAFLALCLQLGIKVSVGLILGIAL